jgi:uncharacterized caspase-like protein
LASEDNGVAVIGSIGAVKSHADFHASRHGAFSEMLLDGLSGAADANQDGTVSVKELERFAKSRVNTQAAGRLRPIALHPRLTPDFPITSRGAPVD